MTGHPRQLLLGDLRGGREPPVAAASRLTSFSYSSRRTQSGLYSRIRAGSNPMRRVSNRVMK